MEMEDIDHLFFTCDFSINVWKSVFRWLKVDVIIFLGEMEHFNVFGSMIKRKKNLKVRHWLATTWNIWCLRNNIVLRGKLPNVSIVKNCDHTILVLVYRSVG
jgi:hypothetical protein